MATTNPSMRPVASILLLRSLLFSLGMVASTVLWGPLVLLTFPLPFERRYRFTQWWARFNIWWLEKTCNIRYELEGLDHLSKKGPAVVLAKHQSTWETLFLQRLFIPQVWVLKRELLWIPVFGWALALLKPIAIDRKAASSAAKQVLRQGTEHLRQGHWVVIFPEGTRVAPRERGHYSMGGAWLAAHSGCPVIPIAHNAGTCWPRRGFMKYPGTIRLVVGPPIESRGRSAQEINTLTEEWIEAAMERIGDSPAAAQTRMA